MRRAKWWAVLLALVFVAGACGGDDGGDDTAAESEEEAAEDTAADDEGTDETTEEEGGEEGEEGDGGDAAAGDLATDFGVDDETIRIGYNADLSGIFAPLVIQIVDSTEVYWDWVNENGGIAGRMVEPVILDNGYDVPTHLENYDRMAGDGPESVVAIGQSTGSPHTAATAESLVEDDLIAIPLSWYSGWADSEIGQNVFEVQTSYCLEAMNAVTYMSEQFGDNVAIISFAGEYGEDGATGAKIAADELGLNVVYDGQGEVSADPNADQSPVINQIVESGADFVWATANPGTLASIMGGAVSQGFEGMWSGNSPTFNFQMLASDLAPALDQYYVHSTYTALWNTEDTPGMTEVVEQMRAYQPDAPISDVYLIGWINGIIVQTILEQAVENGDLTRAGVVAAANEVTVDLKGLAPDQTWSGEPNDYIVRESYMYDVDSSLYTDGLTVSDEEAGTGFELIQGPFSSPTAENYDFQEACFVP